MVKEKRTFFFFFFGSVSWRVDFGAKGPVLKAHDVCMLFHGVSQPNESAGYLLIFDLLGAEWDFS